MNYSFLTTKNFRIDATGRNPKQAYKLALAKLEEINKKPIIDILNNEPIEVGGLTGTYFKYDRNGLHSVYGEYFNI